MIASLALTILGCGDGTRRAGGADAAAPAAPSTSADAGASQVVFSALRCGECHGAIFDEWRPSGHAHASTSSAYAAMRALAGTKPADANGCPDCHAPLSRVVAATDLAAQEGVTCEACHGIRAATAGDGAARTQTARSVISVADEAKQGPRCDLKDHYFHKMGCSPLQRKAEVCSGCHAWSRRVGDQTIAIYTEYDEWRESPAAKEGIVCQDCHMPGLPRESAVGAGEHADVSVHGFLGEGAALRKKALRVEVALRDAGDAIGVDVALTNEGAGHRVPTGMPGREVVVRVTTVGASGARLDTAERALGRRLTDDAGNEVPFTLATRVGADDRLAPKERRTLDFKLAAPGAGTLRVEVVRRALSGAVASALHAERREDAPMAEVTIPFGAPRPGGRSLPRPRAQVSP